MADPFLGEIRIFAGTYAPVGWHYCDGSLINVNDNQALYALIGNLYGGTANLNFALPNLNGRLPIGQGSGTGLSPRLMAQQVGEQNVTLSSANFPAHTHTINGTTGLATATTPGPTLTLGNINGSATFYDSGNAAPTTKKAFNATAFSKTGSGTAHNNMMPAMSMNYIIAVVGTYPSQS